MPDLTVSQLTQVQYKSTLLLPVVDMSAPVGLKNVAIPLGSIVDELQATPIAELPSATSIAQTDLVPLGQDGGQNKVTVAALGIGILSQPAPIGATAPNSGAFTVVTSKSGISNPNLIAADYAVPPSSNAMIVGPIQVAIGATLTVPIGSVLKVY